jgi:hypothetical protein
VHTEDAGLTRAKLLLTIFDRRGDLDRERFLEVRNRELGGLDELVPIYAGAGSLSVTERALIAAVVEDREAMEHRVGLHGQAACLSDSRFTC